MNSATRILLFDLGGVLADFGDPVTAMGLDLEVDDFWMIWIGSSDVREFETGVLATSEFCPRIAGELGQVDTSDFESRFRAWRLKLFAGAEEFIQSVSKHYQLALLSNTNEVHWQQIVSSTPIFSSFAKTFLSFETGHHKPTVESYDQVISHFDCDPGAIFFLDDSPKNVRAAQQLRIDAHQVCGIEQARAIVANDLGNS